MSGAMGAMPPPMPSPGPAPGGAPPGGAPPAAIMAALGRLRGPSPAALPGLGAQADGLGDVRTAIGLLQAALPKLGMGSEVHKAVVKAIQSVSPHLPGDGGDASKLHLAQLAQLADNVRRHAMLAHLQQNAAGAPPAPMMAPTTQPGV